MYVEDKILPEAPVVDPEIEALRRTLTLLSQPGVWTKGLPTHLSQHCLITGVAKSCLRLHGPHPKFWRLERALQSVIGSPYITLWNDAPERTLDQVLNAIRETIKLLERREL